MFPKDEFIVDTGDEVSKARKFWLTCQAVDREFAQRSGLSVVGCDGIRRFRDYIVAPGLQTWTLFTSPHPKQPVTAHRAP
jgi:hypothetical protein